jgi:hypothetical protein
VRANLGQVREPVDLAQQMIVGHMPLKAEAVEQRLLHHPPLGQRRLAITAMKKLEENEAALSYALTSIQGEGAVAKTTIKSGAWIFWWCPGAESNHRHRDFQSRNSPSKIRPEWLWTALNSHY